MGTTRKLALVGVLSLVSACSGIGLLIPEVDQFAMSSAHTEIDAFQQPVGVNEITPTSARKMLESVYEKLIPAARKICQFVEEQETCWWNVEYSPNSDFNAGAGDKNLIIVNHGLLARISSESELAFVMAHEMGHHVANHINEDAVKSAIGAVIGALAMWKILDNQGDCYTYACAQYEADAIERSAELGYIIGNISYSKSQEREADLLAAFILFNSGFDLYESRYLLVKMGAMDPDRKTSLLDTHPAGPDRLATYDKFIQTVYLDDDFMPDKKSKKGASTYVPNPEPYFSYSEAKQGKDDRNNNPETFSGSPHDKSWTFTKFSPGTTPQKNKVTIIKHSTGRTTQNTLNQRYPTTDSEHSDSAVKCFRKGDQYMCDAQEK